MARLFRDLCPGDWQRGKNIAVHGKLSEYLEKTRYALSCTEIASMILFRWDQCVLMDKFVDDQNLQRPNGQICIMWDLDRYYWHERYYTT
ncbi:hypothetical protein B0T17DRAFT_539913 [Bombardia bombarda]|uniref:Uncharacterized protein n=1 Tax=Bombardia bombarda TaxID=252184 RepID=A0AA40BW91_9PEZI|nr:hypothetical protein B0T17DRAFT_539913 [Bombardia bombarda]